MADISNSKIIERANVERHEKRRELPDYYLNLFTSMGTLNIFYLNQLNKYLFTVTKICV